MTDAERKAKEKYYKKIKSINMQFKNDDENYCYYDDISDIAKSQKSTLSAAAKACIYYCIDNRIDISAYIKEK